VPTKSAPGKAAVSSNPGALQQYAAIAADVSASLKEGNVMRPEAFLDRLIGAAVVAVALVYALLR
jgi:hypothetical protein